MILQLISILPQWKGLENPEGQGVLKGPKIYVNV